MFNKAGFEREIARNFYDKTFKIFRRLKTIDDDGGAIIQRTEIGEFKGNAQTGANSRLIDELGEGTQATLAITTHRDNPAEKSDEIHFDGEVFVVEEVLTRDTHKLIAGKIKR